jgi:hypothetical protein
LHAGEGLHGGNRTRATDRRAVKPILLEMKSCAGAALDTPEGQIFSSRSPSNPAGLTYKKLVNDDNAYEALKISYKIRKKYLHALGDLHDKTTLDDIAKGRWAVAKAVDQYLTFAELRSREGRDALLQSLLL